MTSLKNRCSIVKLKSNVHDAVNGDYNFSWPLNDDIITFKVTGQSDLYFHFIVDEKKLTWHVKVNEMPSPPNPAKVYTKTYYHWAERM